MLGPILDHSRSENVQSPAVASTAGRGDLLAGVIYLKDYTPVPAARAGLADLLHRHLFCITPLLSVFYVYLFSGVVS